MDLPPKKWAWDFLWDCAALGWISSLPAHHVWDGRTRIFWSDPPWLRRTSATTMMDDHHAAVVSVQEAKALANILRTRGYFHRGTVPWSSQDASVFGTSGGGTSAVDWGGDPSRPPWIVATAHGLCTIDRLRRDLEALVLVHHGRVTVEETTRHLGIDGTLLQTRVLLNGDQPDDDLGPSSRYVLFGNEIIARQHLQDQVDQVIEDLVKADDNVDAATTTTTPPLAVTTIAETILRVPFETALTLIQERLLLRHPNNYNNGAEEKVVVTLRRSDAGTWLLVTARYWSRLRRDLETALTATTTERPMVLSELAQERSWELGWLREIIAEEKKRAGEKGATGPTTTFWEDWGDFCGDVYTPRQFQIAQRDQVRALYQANGYISAHMCRATVQVHATAMKQCLLYNNENDDVAAAAAAATNNAIVLTHSVVHRAQVAEPLAEAIRDCIDASSWLNLKSLVPIELLAYHPHDVHELLAQISPDPSAYSVWMGDDASALLFTRKLIDSFRTNVMPDVIQRLARGRCQELTTTATLRREASGTTSASCSSNTSKSAKEKHREREAARSSSSQGDTTRDVLDVGLLDGSQIVPALKAIHPDMEELGDDEVILRRACEDSFCTDEANDQYQRAVLKMMDQLDRRHKRALASSADGGDTAVLLSFESGIASLCHLIQARAKFLDHASGRPETMSLLRLALLETSCREFVLRITQAAMVRESVSVDGFGLPATIEPVDLSCVPSIPTGSFWTTSGKVDHRVLKSMTDQLSSAVAPLLLELWKTIDTASMEAEGSASAIGSFLQTANDVCLPISGMPFSKLDKKAEKRLLGMREKHLQTQLFKTSQLDEAVDICISLLYQQVKNVVVFPHSSCRADVLSMLSNERKAPTERIETLKNIVEAMSQGDPVAHLEAVREICF